MNKNGLYLVAALALAITGATFFVTKTDATKVCHVQDVSGTGNIDLIAAPTGAHADGSPTKAIMRGYPLSYYQDPFPVGCMSKDVAGATGGLRAGQLGNDLLIWLAASFVLYMLLHTMRARRDTPMLGDKPGGRRV